MAENMTRREAADYLRIGVSTLDKLRWDGRSDGPPVTRIGRRVIYTKAALDAWLLTRTAGDKAREPGE